MGIEETKSEAASMTTAVTTEEPTEAELIAVQTMRLGF